MKKMLLGLAAAFALTTFAAPAFADDKPAGDTGGEKPVKAKKGKKSKKKDKGGDEGKTETPPAK